jgi:hypothetical protein
MNLVFQERGPIANRTALDVGLDGGGQPYQNGWFLNQWLSTRLDPFNHGLCRDATDVSWKALKESAENSLINQLGHILLHDSSL